MLPIVAYCVFLAEPVVANPIPPPGQIMAMIALVNMPINGLILIGMYALFVHLEGAPPPMGTWRFLELAMESVILMSLLGAMIDMLFVVSSGGAIMSMVGALSIAAIAFWLTSRVLRMTRRGAAATAVGFFAVNFITWEFIVFDEEMWPLFLVLLPICAVLFTSLLGWIIARHHRIEGPIAWDETWVPPSGEAMTEGILKGSFIRDLDDRRSEMRVYVTVILAVEFVLSFV